MDRWAPLFSSIVDSSIWDEDDMVCKVWVTLLALQDSDHVVRKTMYQLARASRKTQEEVRLALAVLEGPDSKRPDQEYEGRRIEKVEGGWAILNGGVYEQKMRDVSRKVYQAKWARERRAKMREVRRIQAGMPTGIVNQKDLEDYIDNGIMPDP